MKISKNAKKTLSEEITFVLNHMKQTTVPADKLYFFSAIYGIAQRLMNFEFDPELCFLFQVLQLAYQTINTRLAAMQSGQEGGVRVPEGLFERLEDSLLELADVVGRGENTCPVLQKILNLAYATTGNGYYLYLKGMLKV